jgi:hypothetical protein
MLPSEFDQRDVAHRSLHPRDDRDTARLQCRDSRVEIVHCEQHPVAGLERHAVVPDPKPERRPVRKLELAAGVVRCEALQLQAKHIAIERDGTPRVLRHVIAAIDPSDLERTLSGRGFHRQR